MKYKDFLKKSHLPITITKSVVTQMGDWDTFTNYALDITNNGIDGGFGGFVWYTETLAFYEANRRDIMAMLRSQADDFGVCVTDMVHGFGSVKRGGYSRSDVEAFLMDNDPESDNYTFFANLMAWYAAEEVCRAYCDMLDESCSP